MVVLAWAVVADDLVAPYTAVRMFPPAEIYSTFGANVLMARPTATGNEGVLVFLLVQLLLLPLMRRETLATGGTTKT